MKKLYRMSAIFMLAIFLSISVYAEDFHHGPHGKAQKEGCMGMHREKMVKELGLTQEQQEKLKEHKQSTMGQMKELREKVKEKRNELKVELEKKELNRSKIDSIVAELKGLNGKKIEHRVEKILFMRELLTDEQYEKFIEKAKEFEKKGHGWKKHKKHGKKRFEEE